MAKRRKKPIQTTVVPFDSGRFAIADANTGEIVDDAQGYGYTTRRKAHKAAWWKFEGGREKAAKGKKAVRSTPLYQQIARDFEKLTLSWAKELARGEIEENELWNELEQKYDISLPAYIRRAIKDLALAS